MLTLEKKVDDPGLKSAHLTKTTLHPAFQSWAKTTPKGKAGVMKIIFTKI